jgi:cell division protein ZapA
VGTVNVEINGRPYSVGCADGQEERLRILARQFDEHVRQVSQDVGSVGELRLFLMAALLVSDELADIRSQLNRLRTDYDRAQYGSEDVGKQAALALTAAAERIEQLLAEDIPA